eukprot:1870910-Pyramimonas_sp.AAC.1
MLNVLVCITVQPRATDVAVVDFIGLACGQQDSLPECGDGLHRRAKERLLALTGAQSGSVSLNHILRSTS